MSEVRRLVARLGTGRSPSVVRSLSVGGSKRWQQHVKNRPMIDAG